MRLLSWLIGVLIEHTSGYQLSFPATDPRRVNFLARRDLRNALRFPQSRQRYFPLEIRTVLFASFAHDLFLYFSHRSELIRLSGFWGLPQHRIGVKM